MNMRVAIIDMGTNTFHLLVAEVTENRHSILAREREAVKIGMGGINDGRITHEGIERAIHALKKFRQTIDLWKPEKVLAFGTSALRSAANGNEVVAHIQQQTGIETKLISGNEEAELIYRGVRAALDLGEQKSLIVDIGGGSVEFIIANRAHLFWKQSLEIGGQRLLEKFQRHDPILPTEVAAMESYLARQLTPVFEKLNEHKPETLVGSSGTFDTLSEMYCHRTAIRYQADEGETPLTLDAFHEIYKDLLNKNRTERLALPGMIEMRVDMIVVACCLANFLINRYAFNHVRVSTYSLKEGVLSSWM